MTGSSLPILGISSSFGDALAFSADGKCLALADGQSVIKFFDPETGILLQTLNDFEGKVMSVAFTANGQHLISGSEDGLVKVWAIVAGTCLYTLEEDGWVNSVTFSVDHQYLVSGSYSAKI